jgi:hypothetical protein
VSLQVEYPQRLCSRTINLRDRQWLSIGGQQYLFGRWWKLTGKQHDRVAMRDAPGLLRREIDVRKMGQNGIQRMQQRCAGGFVHLFKRIGRDGGRHVDVARCSAPQHR